MFIIAHTLLSFFVITLFVINKGIPAFTEYSPEHCKGKYTRLTIRTFRFYQKIAEMITGQTPLLWNCRINDFFDIRFSVSRDVEKNVEAKFNTLNRDKNFSSKGLSSYLPMCELWNIKNIVFFIC